MLLCRTDQHLQETSPLVTAAEEVTPDTESKDSHTFAAHSDVTLDHFSSINK